VHLFEILGPGLAVLQMLTEQFGEAALADCQQVREVTLVENFAAVAFLDDQRLGEELLRRVHLQVHSHRLLEILTPTTELVVLRLLTEHFAVAAPADV